MQTPAERRTAECRRRIAFA